MNTRFFRWCRVLPFCWAYLLACTCIGLHPGRVEPASSRASTVSRTIAAHVRRLHEMASQSRFHRRRPTTSGPDSTARSSLIVLAYVFSWPPTRFRQLGREVGSCTSWTSSPSGRRAACPNHRRRRRSRRSGRGWRFRRRRDVVFCWAYCQSD